MRTLTVAAPSHSYPIFIGENLLAKLAEHLAPHVGKKAAVITNTTVAHLYLQHIQTALTALDTEHFAVILPDGEAHKNIESLNRIYDELLRRHAERGTTLIALGGGVIGDTAGFAAATYQRGAPFVQIPTTLLSQVDSSVGGKTAVNHPLGKNMIGAFYQPQAVIADLTALATLPAREFSAGMAEVIKYALLGDAAFLAWLEDNIDAVMAQQPDALAHTVYHCCAMKAAIVAADETERGIRAHLNLGHTFGHAIEAQMGYGNWLHGEAVAAGMVLACRLSEQTGRLKAADTERAAALIRRAGLPDAPPRFPFEKWLSHMRHDKKVSGGTMRFVGLDRLGAANITPVEDPEILRRTLAPYL